MDECYEIIQHNMRGTISPHIMFVAQQYVRAAVQ